MSILEKALLPTALGNVKRSTTTSTGALAHIAHAPPLPAPSASATSSRSVDSAMPLAAVDANVHSAPLPTAVLHELRLHLPRADRTKIEAEQHVALDRAELDRMLAEQVAASLDDDERATARAEFRESIARLDREVAWSCSATGRLMTALEADGKVVVAADGDEPSIEWFCPACQRDVCLAFVNDTMFSCGDVAQLLVIEHRFRRDTGAVVRAACRSGCTPEALAKAMSAFVIERETHEARQVAARAEAEIAAELAPLSLSHAEQPWCVPGVVADQASTLLVGASGHGKSWVASHLALTVASGQAWLGREVARTRVLLCLLESRVINERKIRRLASSLGLDVDALWREQWLSFWPDAKPLKMDDRASRSELARFVRARGFGLIVIDNASQLRSGGSENDSSVVGAAMEPLAQLAQLGVINGERVSATPPAIVTVHHANRNGETRGSTSYAQHADAVIELRRRDPEDPESSIRLSFGEGTRIASGALPLSMRFRGVAPDPVVPELITKADPGKAVELKPTHAKMLAALTAEPGASINALVRRAQISKRDAGPALRELELRGLAELRDDGWHTVEAPE